MIPPLRTESPQFSRPKLEDLLRLGQMALGKGWLALYVGESPQDPIAAVGIEPSALADAPVALTVPLPEHDGHLAVGQAGKQRLTKRQREAAAMVADQVAAHLQQSGREQHLGHMTDSYRYMIDSLPHAVVVVDREGRYFNNNQAFNALLARLDLPAVSVADRGTPIHLLCASDLCGRLASLRERLMPDTGPLKDLWEQPQGYFRITAVPIAQPTDAPGAILFMIEDVTERHRMRRAIEERNRELQASHSNLTALLDATESPILMSDSEGIVRHANRTMTALLRLPHPQIMGQPVREVMAAAAERFDNPPNFLQRANWLYDHPRVVARDHVKTRTGRPRYFERYSAPVYHEIGSDVLPGRIEVFTNQTKHRRMEAALRDHNARISHHLARHRALYEVGMEAIGTIEVEPPLETLMAHVTSLFGADGMAMLLRSATGVKAVASVGLSAGYLQQEVAQFDHTAASRAVNQRTPIMLADVCDAPDQAPLHAALRDAGIRTVVYVPLIYRDEEVGLLGLYHRDSYRYSTEEMELLAIFANQATSVLKMSQLYDSLRTGQEQLNAILNSMTDGVVAVDDKNRIIFANKALCSLLNLKTPRAEWVGREARTLEPPLAKILDLVLRESRSEMLPFIPIELELPAPARVLQVMAMPIVQTLAAQGVLVLIHDITELRRSEETTENLIATISHELRTPLTSIIGYSKLLATRPEAPIERRTHWSTILNEKGKQLQQEVDDLLDLSVFRRQRVQMDFEPVVLDALIQEIVTQCQAEAPAFHIVVDLTPLAPMWLDASRVRRAIANLLDNAINYSPSPSVITVRLRGESSWVVISIHDEGVGIAPEHMDRVFEPFFRVNNALDRTVYGTGLGLSLARSIAHAHGGELILKSTLGEGTTAVLSLPRRAIAEHDRLPDES